MQLLSTHNQAIILVLGLTFRSCIQSLKNKYIDKKSPMHQIGEPSCTLSGSVNWCSHSGKQYGGSSES